MSKQITITFRQYVFDTWLKDYSGNKSAFIEENFIKGLELKEAENYKLRFIELTKQNRELEEENKKLLAKIGRLEQQLNPQARLTPSEVWTEEEINAFKEGLYRSPFRLKIWKETLRLLNVDQKYFEGRFKFFNNETGDNIDKQEFNRRIVMYRELIKRGEFQ